MPVADAKAHLIHSPGFARNFLINIVMLSAIAAFVRQNTYLRHNVVGEIYDNFLSAIMDQANELAWWSVIGLLSSACCALQLVLSLFSVGCAGFNTYLGPIRPFALAVCMLLQMRSWSLVFFEADQYGVSESARRNNFQMAALSSSVTLVLTFLPEMLWLRLYVSGSDASKKKDGSSCCEQGGITVEMSIDNMGCVACITTITNNLEALDFVKSARIELDNKKGFIKVDKKALPEGTTRTKAFEKLVATVDELGFPAEVLAVKEFDSPDDEKRSGDAPRSRSKSKIPGDGSEVGAGTFVLDGLKSLTAGLLGSSCCLLQLGLNWLSALDVIHVGCAGFNKVLGPVRTYIRALVIGWLVLLWSRYLFSELITKNANLGRLSKKFRSRLLFSTFLTLSLTFLPEALKHMGGPAIAPPGEHAELQVWVVDNMGCEACVDGVTKMIEKTDGVLYTTVDFESGEAEMYVARDWKFDQDALNATLVDAGYELRPKGWETQKQKFEKKMAAQRAAKGDSGTSQSSPFR